MQAGDQLGRVGSQYASRADRQNRGQPFPNYQVKSVNGTGLGDWLFCPLSPHPEEEDLSSPPKPQRQTLGSEDSAVSRAAATLCRYANRDLAVSLLIPDGWRQSAPTTADATFMSECGRLSMSDMNRRPRHASVVGAPGG